MLPFRKFVVYLSFSFFFLANISTSSSTPLPAFITEETSNNNNNINTIVNGRKVNMYPYSREGERMKEEEDVKVTGIFKIESPSGKPISGMTLVSVDNAYVHPYSISGSGWERTNENGTASLSMKANKFFIVKGSKRPIYQDLYIFGYAGKTDFYYTTLLGSKKEAKILANKINVPYNESRGYIVIGLDDMINPMQGLIPSNLEPAIGASVEIKGFHEEEGGEKMEGANPIIFSPLPTEGNQIVEKGSSFVTFPNYEPKIRGKSQVTPPPSSQCLISPGFYSEDVNYMPVYAFPDAVTVVSYICIKI